jgi:hypothetical protein
MFCVPQRCAVDNCPYVRKIGIILVKPIVMVSAMRLPDYIAISFLFALTLWCVAGLARHKFKL